MIQNIEDNFCINENAYYYKIIEGKSISKRDIITTFSEGASKRTGSYLHRTIKAPITIGDKNIRYSLCIFKYKEKPTFLEVALTNWDEVKFAYILIVEIDDYIVINKKNTSISKKLLDKVESIDYKIISTLFVNNTTAFEKFALKNLAVTDSALRGKTIEALDLRDNTPALGASNYVVNSMRINNKNEKTSIALNTSRINKMGGKIGIQEFFEWATLTVNAIINHKIQNTFLSRFAEPQDFEKMRSKLVPSSILFIFTPLYDDYDWGNIVKVFYKHKNGSTREISIIKYLKKYEKTLLISLDGDEYKIDSKNINDLKLVINKRSIKIKSKKLNNLFLVNSKGTEVSIVEYINLHNNYIITFDNIELIYTNNKLFRDSKLLGNISHFLDIFEPLPGLSTVDSEKGIFVAGQTAFSNGSIFQLVESTFAPKYNFFICDDLNEEWADHIGITNDRVSFYHSKHKTSEYSASAFQDIIGQGLKNLSFLTPQNSDLQKKETTWQSSYTNNKVSTNIKRLRKGTSVSSAISEWEKTIYNPYLKKDVCLVINFISKDSLENHLTLLKNGMQFTERNETAQRLWFISSFISSCRELNVEPKIYCKP